MPRLVAHISRGDFTKPPRRCPLPQFRFIRLAVEVVGSSRLMGRDKTGRRVEENGYVRARIIQALKRSPRSGRWLGA
jgi:hypothetical protein